MNQADLMRTRKTIWYKHNPDANKLHRCKVDGFNFNVSNSIEHETAKFHVCFYLRKSGRKFISEAYSNLTGDRHDVVCLDDGYIYEVETDPKRAKRFDGRPGIVVVKLWETPNIAALVGSI